MKLLLITVLAILVSGCDTFGGTKCKDECIIKVPTYEKPKFDMPARPQLRDVINLKTDGEVVRAVELNTLDLMTYSNSLEELLKSFK